MHPDENWLENERNDTLGRGKSLNMTLQWPRDFMSVERAERKVRETGRVLAGFRTAGSALEEMFHGRGYGLVVGSVDLAMLRESARKDAQEGEAAVNTN